MAKVFNDIQAFFAFLNVLQDSTKRVDSDGNAVDLLSNLDPSGKTNLAVELAKIYSWYTQAVVYDTTTNPPTFTINPNVIPDTFDNVTEGYYDEATDKFYTDSTKTTEIPGEPGKIYVDTTTDIIYRYDSTNGFSELFGGGSTYAFRSGTTAGAFEVQEDGGAWQTISIYRAATLDDSGKVPSSQLPSYVDDVIEGYMNDGSFYDEPDCVKGYYDSGTGKFYEDAEHTTEITPAEDTLYIDLGATPNTAYVYDSDTSAYVTATAATPESGKIYVDLDSNKTYRWSGSVYVEIAQGLTLGETSSTAYRGDRGKIAYDHSQLTSGNPHNVTAADVGLGNVDNTADANKSVASAATLTTARTIDGVSFDGSANITHYGTCSTTASTPTKEVDCTGFAKAAGARIAVKFSVTNTGAAADLQLNVNSTGGAPIKWRGAALPDNAVLTAGRVYEFVYDGTNYELVGDLDTGIHTGDILILHCTQNPSLLP